MNLKKLMSDKFLYYPNILIPDESWVKSSLLYWDQMQFICPDEYVPKINTAHVKDLMDAGLVINASPMNYIEDVWNFGDAFMELLLTIYSTNGSDVFGSTNKNPFYIHKNKMQYGLFKKLEAFGGAADKNEDWYIVREDIGSLYMMVIAYLIAHKNENMSLMTNNDPVITVLHKISKNLPSLNEYKQEANNSFLKHFQKSIVNLLPVPKDIDSKELLRLKEKHGSSLNKFKKTINQRYQEVLQKSGVFTISEEDPILRHRYSEILSVELTKLFSDLEKEAKDLEDNLKTTSNLSWTRAGISLIPTVASALVNTSPDIATQAISILVVGMANLASYAGRDISQAVDTRNKLLAKSNLEFSFYFRNKYSNVKKG